MRLFTDTGSMTEAGATASWQFRNELQPILKWARENSVPLRELENMLVGEIHLSVNGAVLENHAQRTKP